MSRIQVDYAYSKNEDQTIPNYEWGKKKNEYYKLDINTKEKDQMIAKGEGGQPLGVEVREQMEVLHQHIELISFESPPYHNRTYSDSFWKTQFVNSSGEIL